ncbi:S41 family peptidase [Paraflavitalea sp. CAU 1676]|uniref:S41 family peptidase n=1 Tax=Paraflavitalea sp. CAU 1676 TaxID=3032598 RepID=UPI0023DBC85A|nr:S41 family peptidase [Paraflavitalea sp. CAU 1676]MDF2187685.1 S41 family peptidase [Paraflavitalea sp. CAU 1676]
MRIIFIASLLLATAASRAQSCDCEKEFLHIKGFMEANYAGFKDKLAVITPAVYERKSKVFLQLSKKNGTGEQCLAIITAWLDMFKDDHVQVSINFDALKLDSQYISSRPIHPIPEKKLSALQKSKGPEGIYLSQYDSSYRIAVIKDQSPLHDYVGIMVNSKIPNWKPGMTKFEGHFINDTVLKGVLYMRNHMPKVEYFYLGKNVIGGDWLREGSAKEKRNVTYEPVASRQLSDKTFYIKISNFSPSNAKNIDSLFTTHKDLLSKMPYLVIDVRDNGGGADFAYGPLVPLLYTNPNTTTGVDVLATDANITGWKQLLTDPDLPESSKNSVRDIIGKMEGGKGRFVSLGNDGVDSSLTPLAFPKKVVFLINGGCASTTEQLLLYARQSSKVILAGENTDGTLDYSNMREHPFSCMPYILNYATTRSRRIDKGEGIDEKGIQPNVRLKPGTDWIAEAVKLLEQAPN